MTSVLTNSANLASMAQGTEPDTTEWISPIGQSVSDYIAEQERLFPDYKKHREENRPRRELARMILIRRTELGITQRELADRMGTSLSVIARLERGQQNFSATTLQRLARALDTKLVYTFEVSDAGSEPTRSLVVVP
jgi:ribosome-binding protein aMBF1 (putative translation factor)